MDRRSALRTDRRTVLRRAVATGSLLSVAGCMGSKADQGTSLSKANTDFYENDDGRLELSVVVSNSGNAPESGLLLVHAELNGETYDRVREISLDAHATKEYLFTFDVKWTDVQSFSPNVTVQEQE